MKNKLKGITLLETLIYVGLFSIIMFMILNFMLSTQETNLKTERKQLINQSSLFVVQHIEDSFKNVDSINGSSSIFQNDQGHLELVYGEETKEYTILGSTLYFDGIPITSPNILVNKFYLQPVYQGNSEVVGVKIEILFVSPSDSNITDTVNMLFTVR